MHNFDADLPLQEFDQKFVPDSEIFKKITVQNFSEYTFFKVSRKPTTSKINEGRVSYFENDQEIRSKHSSSSKFKVEVTRSKSRDSQILKFQVKFYKNKNSRLLCR